MFIVRKPFCLCQDILTMPHPANCQDSAASADLDFSTVKEGCAPDIRPIAVGETLRRLVGKCMCALLKVKAADFFQPLQFGVACRAGAENVTHGLRICIEEHWSDDDFVAFKVDMKNAFYAVSRQAVVEECATFFCLGCLGVMGHILCYGTL
ncbi:hypothetical protein EMCRGX_G024896 [Ephydatia muelleri]